MNQYKNSYDWLTSISSLNFEKKSVFLIGAGYMGTHFAKALHEMNIRNVSIYSRKPEKSEKLSKLYGFSHFSGSLNTCLEKIGSDIDLTIIATPIEHLIPIAKKCIDFGHQNILIEKPGSLFYSELLALDRTLTSQRVRIGYNRLVYPNLHKLKKLIESEGGISSCNFTFTEFVDSIDFKKENQDSYTRWGISNSLHIISMVFDLIGLPTEYLFYQSGSLKWHPSGSVFVGSGISKNKIPFSFHADWGSSGRWGIQIMTKHNAYRLISLEELFVCPVGSMKWRSLPFKKSYPEIKQGISEEISLMLYADMEKKIPLVTLKHAASFNQMAEKILGYDKLK